MFEYEGMTLEPGDYVVVDITAKWYKQPWKWFINAAIRKSTQSEYSHAFILMDDSGRIIEARPKGAAENNIAEYMGLNMLPSSTKMTKEQREMVVYNASGFIGIPYGFLDILWLGMASRGINWGWLMNKVRNENRMICSQLVAQSGINSKVMSWLCGKPYPQEVTPGDLGRLAERQAKQASQASDLRKQEISA